MTVKEICLDALCKNYAETYGKEVKDDQLELFNDIAIIANTAYRFGYRSALSECPGGGYGDTK